MYIICTSARDVGVRTTKSRTTAEPAALASSVHFSTKSIFNKKPKSLKAKKRHTTLASSVWYSRISWKVDNPELAKRRLKVRPRRSPSLKLAVPYTPSYHTIEGEIKLLKAGPRCIPDSAFRHQVTNFHVNNRVDNLFRIVCLWL